MKSYIIKVEQYLSGKWVTLKKSKTFPCTREEAFLDVEKVQKLFMYYEKVEISDEGRVITVTVVAGPVRVSISEAYFKKWHPHEVSFNT